MKKTLILSILLTTFQLKGQVASTIDSFQISISSVDLINTEKDDFGVVFGNDFGSIYFTSTRNNEFTTKRNENIENIFSVTDSLEGDLSYTPSLVSYNGRDFKRNTSISYLNAESNHMIIYRDEKNGQGNLYECHLISNNWSEPVPIQGINSDFHESSAILTKSKKTMYFISNRPGGQGGKDIWKANKDADGQWTNITNLGSTINSSLDEEGLYLSEDEKVLYFSSKGFNSIGGFDIFYSELKTTGWSKPKSLGTPINTVRDDVYFVFGQYEKTAYYSSITDKDDYDIYQIIFNKTVKKEIRKVVSVYRKLEDNYTKQVVSGKVKVIDAISGNLIGTHNVDSLTGEFKVLLDQGIKYDLIYDVPGYERHSEEIFMDGLSKTYVENNGAIALNKIGPKYAVFQGKVLDKNMKTPLESNIQIKDPLTNQIVNSFKSDPVTGEFKTNLLPGKMYDVTIDSKDYMYFSDKIYISDTMKTFSLKSSVELQKLNKGAEIELKNIFYTYNSYDLLPDSYIELNKLVELFQKNPNLRVELSSHTDSRGSTESNLILSQKRSNAVVEYLLKYGIQPERLLPKGYGESNPVVSDQTISKLKTKAAQEAAHAKNRRTEFVVL